MVGLMAAACVLPTRASNNSVAANAVMELDGRRANAERAWRGRCWLGLEEGGWVEMYSHHVPGLRVDAG